MNAGLVYILRDPLHKDAIVKIGHTTRESETRAKELTSVSGVPWGFEVLYEEAVLDSHKAERLIHSRLAAFRVNRKREFFRLPLKDAVRAVFEVCMQVNREISNCAKRIVIWTNDRLNLAKLRNTLEPVAGGSTSVFLFFRSADAEVHIILPERWRISLKPDVVLWLSRLEGVSDVMVIAQ